MLLQSLGVILKCKNIPFPSFYLSLFLFYLAAFYFSSSSTGQPSNRPWYHVRSEQNEHKVFNERKHSPREECGRSSTMSRYRGKELCLLRNFSPRYRTLYRRSRLLSSSKKPLWIICSLIRDVLSLSLRLKRLLLPCATIAFLMNTVIYNAWRLLLSGLLGAETGDTSKAPLSFMCHTLLEWLSSTHRRSRWGLCVIRLFACTQIKCVKLQHISRKIIDEANEEYQSILCANIDDFMYL